MTQLLVAHMKLKMIHKLIQKFDPCVNKDETKFEQKVNPWNIMLMEHNAQEACNSFVIQEIPRLDDKLINKQDCITHSKFFTFCIIRIFSSQYFRWYLEKNRDDEWRVEVQIHS